MEFSSLISTASLASILDQKNLILLDASIPPVGGVTPAVYSWPDVTIQGARRFDLKGAFSDQDNALAHMMPSAEQFQCAAQALGINNDSQIVVYDDLGIYSSARAWWMFKAMGHQKVAVLDGGLPKWLKEQRATASAGKLPLINGDFIATKLSGYFCDATQVLESIQSKNSIIFDARAAKRFLGTTPEPRAGVRSGHIPNSINLPFEQLLDHGQLMSKAQLKDVFTPLANPNQQLLFSCGSGITACVLTLAAEVAGYQHLTVYDGSWAEWGSNHQLPIA